ncbi:hypothetical protein V1511DRAFT_504414 [Dipodascopsis uninucleata]
MFAAIFRNKPSSASVYKVSSPLRCRDRFHSYRHSAYFSLFLQLLTTSYSTSTYTNRKVSTHSSIMTNSTSEGPDKPHIVVIGGCLGGHAFIDSFTKFACASMKPLDMPRITVIESRRGIMSPIAIPRAIVDPGFAKVTFESPGSFSEDVQNHVEFIEGMVTHMTDKEVTVDYLSNTIKLSFDYCVISTGRKRQEFIMPPVRTKAEYVDFLNSYVERFRMANNIVIIGGGAVGCETAAEAKYHYPEKTVTLIHSRETLPPEPVNDEFRQKVLEALKIVGVDVQLNTRAKLEKDGVVMTTDGRQIPSDFTLWCTSRGECNTKYMDAVVFKTSLGPAGEVKINRNMSIVGYRNIFAIGDVNDFPVIKTAGGARIQAETAAINMLKMMEAERTGATPVLKELEPWGTHIAMLIGQKMGIFQTQNTVSQDYASAAELFGDDMATERMFSSIRVKSTSKKEKERQIVDVDTAVKVLTIQ